MRAAGPDQGPLAAQGVRRHWSVQTGLLGLARHDNPSPPLPPFLQEGSHDPPPLRTHPPPVPLHTAVGIAVGDDGAGPLGTGRGSCGALGTKPHHCARGRRPGARAESAAARPDIGGRDHPRRLLSNRSGGRFGGSTRRHTVVRTVARLLWLGQLPGSSMPDRFSCCSLSGLGGSKPRCGLGSLQFVWGNPPPLPPQRPAYARPLSP